MFKTFTRAAVLAALLTTPAFAANWSGLYAGLNAGVGMANGQFSDGCYFCATDNYDNNYALGGAQAGFNWQDGAFVLGPEVDFDWTSLSRKGILGTDDSTFLRESAKMTWLISARARAGLAVDNALLYVTAGPVWGHTDTPGIEYCCGPLDTTPTASGNTFSTSGTRTGMAGGMGIEVMTGDNLSIRGEYLYADFGSKTANRVPVCAGADICEVHNSLNTQMIRLAVNWHFGP
jgi:outer membrane autotransporter protein